MGKPLFGMQESREAVIQRGSVDKVFLKNCTKFIGKYLCGSLFLIKFQALKPATSL